MTCDGGLETACGKRLLIHSHLLMSAIRPGQRLLISIY